MRKQKFHPWWLLKMECFEDERGHYEHVLLEAQSKRGLDKAVRQRCMENYGGPVSFDKDAGCYWFNNGRVAVYADELTRVATEEEFETLKKYL